MKIWPALPPTTELVAQYENSHPVTPPAWARALTVVATVIFCAGFGELVLRGSQPLWLSVSMMGIGAATAYFLRAK